MSSERSLAAEASLAHGLLADIRPMAGVDPSMARQTGGVGEGSMTALMVTNVGFLAGVRSRMHSQGASLNEAFVAVLERAAVRAFVCVYSVMSDEVGLAVEGSSATLPGAVEITSVSWRHDGRWERGWNVGNRSPSGSHFRTKPRSAYRYGKCRWLGLVEPNLDRAERGWTLD